MTFRSILVASDFSDASNRAVSVAAAMADKCGAELHLVHVAPSAASRAHYSVVRGDPVKRLQELTGELGTDLICLGVTGKGAVERVLLGSVALSLIRTSSVPVLSVP